MQHVSFPNIHKKEERKHYVRQHISFPNMHTAVERQYCVWQHKSFPNMHTTAERKYCLLQHISFPNMQVIKFQKILPSPQFYHQLPNTYTDYFWYTDHRENVELGL